MKKQKQIIITKTPLRISFCGGGSDLPSYYKRNGGCVISTTINKYIYVICKKNFSEEEIKLKYLDNIENIKKVKDINNDILRETLNDNLVNGVEIVAISDVPNGTGLGSSSTFTVGLIKAIKEYMNEHELDKNELANSAWMIESQIGNRSIGKQDQWAAAFGGLNYYQFNKDGTVEVESITLEEHALNELQNNLFMVYVGGEHKSYDILKEQAKKFQEGATIDEQQKICELVPKLKKELKKCNFDALGKFLNENWQLKKKLAAGISNDRLDSIYKMSLENGATGGKLLGAGGSGFFLFYVPKKNHDRFNEFVRLKNLKILDFKFEKSGSEIIFEK